MPELVHYYAVFFGGCSEISTIFLVLCDFDVYFPAQRGSLWGMIILFCQVSFTFTFLYYRVIGWLQVSISLWSDVLAVAKKKEIEQHRPGLAWFVYAFLVMDFLLGILQLYWFGFGIMPKILEILQDDSK
jgi:TLC domain